MLYGRMYLAASTRIGRKFRFGADCLWLAPSDAQAHNAPLSVAAIQPLNKSHNLWPTHGIVTPVSDTSELALDRFGDDKTHQFAAFRTGRRVRTSGYGDARV